MAHVVDLTLFYGGIASAPTAELPLAGSSFDVQAGTLRRAVFGVPQAVSVADVRPASLASRAWQMGSPAASYRALAKPQGFSRSLKVGVATVLVTKEVVARGVEARTPALGACRVATGANARVAGVAVVPHRVGTLTVGYTAAIGATGFARQCSIGRVGIAIRVFPAGLLKKPTLGAASALSGLAVQTGSAGVHAYALAQLSQNGGTFRIESLGTDDYRFVQAVFAQG